jgi:UDP-glucuronate decarboxylase
LKEFMRVLVAGGAGFLGSHLCKRLLSDGHEVIALDNFYTGSKSNIKDFLTNPNFELIRHDVTVPIEIEIDAIYNLACPASPVHYQKFPVQTLKTSVLGALNLLELARRLNVRILQASTSEVYGDPKISPQPEEYWGNVNPHGLRSCYDEGKRAAESLFFDFNRQYGVDVRVPRIFNTYGPHMALDDGRVVTNFISQALSDQPITVYGEGNQTRSLCYVDDLIDGLVLLFEKPEIHQPINLGNPTPVTMLQLAEEIKTLCNSKSEIVFKPLPSDDPLQREPDITKAKEILGWTPVIGRREGLQKTIDEIVSRVS